MATTKNSLDKPSLWVVITASILILIIVTAGVGARLLLGELKARIVLISFILLVSIIGMSALSYLEVRRWRIQKYNKTLVQKNSGFLYQNISQGNSLEPSAPKSTGSTDYTNRETMCV